MSGRNRQFRKKRDDGQTGNDADAPATTPGLSIPAAGSAKEKDRKSKKVSLLSFDDEEGPSPIKIKASIKERSKSKLKPNLGGLRLTEEVPKPVSSQQSQAGEYSKDRLKELRANAKSFTGPRAPMSSVHGKPEEAGEQSGGVFKLSGSFKPAARKDDDRFDPIIPDKGSKQQHPQAARGGGGGQKASAGNAPAPVSAAAADAEEEDEAVQLPSAEMIRLAKQKRERMRSAIAAPDYVSLSSGGGVDLATLASQLKPEGGLEQAKQDGDESGSDEDQRMTFVGDRTTAVRRGRGGALDAGIAPQVQGMDEEADDLWAQDQIRKGGGVGVSPAPRSSAAGYPSGGRVSKADAAAFNLSGEAALAALQQNFQRLKATQANIEKQAKRTEENMNSSVAQCGDLEDSLEAASAKYTFLQQLKAYIADLCDMLQAKAAVVEELEEHLMAAGEGRAAARAQRSAADEAAEMEPASAAISAALNVLSRGGEAADAKAAAAAAVSHAEERANGASGPAELDEFGRDIRLEGNAEEGKRKDRREARNRKWQDDPDGKGGADTTDESDSEIRQHSRRRREVLETAGSVFADADNEYGSLAAVKRRLEAWKREQPGAYGNAYAADSVPAIFAPFVRNELLAWEPVFEESPDFDRQQWFNLLLDYGAVGAGDAANGAGEDDELIPKLVANLIQPLAIHAVQVTWNPFSRKQTKQVVKMLDHILVYLPTDHPKAQELLSEARSRLEAAIPLVKLPPWPAAAVSAAPTAAAFLAHRFGKALRLLEVVASFDSLLPRAALQAMAFESIIQQQLMTYILGANANTEAVVKRSERLADALPKAWLQNGVPAAAKPFAEHLKKVARSLESRRKEGVPGTTPLARRLLRALQKLGETDAAKRLSTAYKL